MGSSEDPMSRPLTHTPEAVRNNISLRVKGASYSFKLQQKLEFFCLSFPLCEMGIIYVLMAFVVGIHTMQLWLENSNIVLEHRAYSAMFTLLVVMAMNKCCSITYPSWQDGSQYKVSFNDQRPWWHQLLLSTTKKNQLLFIFYSSTLWNI